MQNLHSKFDDMKSYCILLVLFLIFSRGQCEENQTAFTTTADACDANEKLLASGDLRVLQPIFQSYGKRSVFSGKIFTLRVFDNNEIIFDVVKTQGKGRVLVIDGGGSEKSAFTGGQIAEYARVNGWAGIVVNGYIRDSVEINGKDIGVKAKGTYPKRGGRDHSGEKNVPVYVAGTWIRDGEWLYADVDGVLISKTALSVFKVEDSAAPPPPTVVPGFSVNTGL